MKKDAPITKKEFREEMDGNMQLIANAFEKVVTKEHLDETLKNTLEPYVTKEHLDETLKNALEPYATKEDLKELRKELKEDIKGVLDSALEGMESSVVKVLHNQDKRITAIERQI
ncbi:MAG: hypothetical protein O3A36_02940 [bacterium]|nr:hypothetical protein [bacterium]